MHFPFTNQNVASSLSVIGRKPLVPNALISSIEALFLLSCLKKVKLSTGSAGPYSCETSRLQQFVDKRLTDGGEVVNLTRRSPFTHRNIPGFNFW
jgi:hypothetical protein